jgi:hypothetical protein
MYSIFWFQGEKRDILTLIDSPIRIWCLVR